ncbi:hypothetical protein FOA52_008583 [Chlamydomonas sp. UWO 241]|nr:hypothetical protein FOA52_008583 [Chlamydomonas sp. UWO 241]
MWATRGGVHARSSSGDEPQGTSDSERDAGGPPTEDMKLAALRKQAEERRGAAVGAASATSSNLFQGALEEAQLISWPRPQKGSKTNGSAVRRRKKPSQTGEGVAEGPGQGHEGAMQGAMHAMQRTSSASSSESEDAMTQSLPATAARLLMEDVGPASHTTFTVHGRSASYTTGAAVQQIAAAMQPAAHGPSDDGGSDADATHTLLYAADSGSSSRQQSDGGSGSLRIRRGASDVPPIRVSSLSSLLPTIPDEAESGQPASPAPGATPNSGLAADTPNSCASPRHTASMPPKVGGGAGAAKVRSEAGSLDASKARASMFGTTSTGGTQSPGAPGSAEPMQSFSDYLLGEASPLEKLPTADFVWGQTERDRVYNFLLYVPYQLERLLEFSLLLCIDSFMGVLTMVPLRGALAMAHALRAPQVGPSSTAGASASAVPQRTRLHGSQIFDILTLLILVAVTIALRAIRPGFIYFMFKDITNEFLKMSVLSSLFEIADRILGTIGLDVLEALSGTCTQWALGTKRLSHVAADTLVATCVVLLHAVTLMCQALILAVALNSHRHGLIGLLIASNFVEIKGSVFKRWDIERIRTLAKADVVERFQLMCVLVFIIVEDMDSSATFVPSSSILRESLRILGAEVVIDIVKHACVGKFNDVRPGIYREYMRDLCVEVSASQSHNLHKLLGFHHLACSALVLRSAVTLFWLKLDADVGWRSWQVCGRLGIAAACWLALLASKMLFGYGLKLIAHSYTCYFTPAHSHHGHAAAMLAKGGASRASSRAPSTSSKQEVPPAVTPRDRKRS